MIRIVCMIKSFGSSDQGVFVWLAVAPPYPFFLSLSFFLGPGLGPSIGNASVHCLLVITDKFGVI